MSAFDRIFRQRERRLRFGAGIFDPILGDTPSVGGAGPFGGFEFGGPEFFPLLLNENWNYPSGQLSLTAAPWSASDAGWNVTQGQYINTVAGATSNAKLAAAGPGYLPNKAYAMTVTFFSADNNKIQVVFELGQGSSWVVSWTAEVGFPSTFAFSGGGAGSDAAISDATWPQAGTAATLVAMTLAITVSPLINGQRTAKVVATSGTRTTAYSRKIGAPSSNAASAFEFGSNVISQSGGDDLRVGPFTFHGFTS